MFYLFFIAILFFNAMPSFFIWLLRLNSKTRGEHLTIQLSENLTTCLCPIFPINGLVSFHFLLCVRPYGCFCG